MSGTIKISELNTFPALLTTEDFFPIDKSSSLLTYRATLGQLQTLLSTGSFSGSLIGSSSYATNSNIAISATSSSYALTSSYANTSNSSSYALTASYVSASGTTIGPGTVNYLPTWTGTNTLGDSNIYYTASIGYVSYNRNIAIEKGQAFFISRGTFNCGYTLQSVYTSSDAWQLSCGTENTGTARGIFEISTYSGSNQLINKQSNDPDGYGTVRALRVRGNGFYFWPLGGAQSVSRDGTFNIGVDSGTENTSARLLISVYSGSSASNPQTYHIQKAIEVQYGSSSAVTTFCVSSSGTVIAAGGLYLGNNITHTSQTYLGATSSLYPNGVRLSATEDRLKYLQFSNNMTASVEMQAGQIYDVIVNQAGITPTASIHFTGSFLSSSGTYHAAPIIWPNNTHPQNYTGSTNTASLFRFMCVSNGGNGPGGDNILYPHQRVIYGKLVDLTYY